MIHKTVFLFTILSCLFSDAQSTFNVTFEHDGLTCYGTFTKPAGNGKFPVILINPGSGANDKDGTLQMSGGNAACLYPGLLNETLKPYKGLSDAFVKEGYAVLRYDKVEYTYKTGISNITFHKLWMPIESAVRYVKTRDDVDSNSIILLGHSEGSSIIPIVANRIKNIKALISLAGNRTPFDSLLAWQVVEMTKKCNGDVNQAQGQANQILAYYNIIRSNNWDQNTPDLFGVPASVWYDYINAVDSVSTYYNMAGVPTLFIGLEKDINVPLSELARFKDEVNITDDFWRVDSLIHYLCTENSPNTSKTLTDTIIYWLKSPISSLRDLRANKLNCTVFPNPSRGKFIIELNESTDKDIQLSIFDMHGRRLLYEIRQADNKMILDLKALQTGMYILQLESAGKTVRTVIRKED